MDKYVPQRDGNLRTIVDIQADSITYEQEYAKYQYKGMREDGSRPVRNYTTPGTGPYWDKRMVSAEMQDVVKEEGFDFEIAPWDYYYYAEKVRQKKYALDEDEVRQYFAVDNVVKGIFSMANRLYGISFRELPDAPKYHPEVTVYEVLDSAGKHVSVFMTDYFPRESKRQGAWMSEFKGSYIDENGKEYAINVELLKNDAEIWCEAGYPVASEQFVLQERTSLTSAQQGSEALVVDNSNGVSVTNSNISFKLDAQGFITEWIANGVQVVEPGKFPIYSNIRWIENESPYGEHVFGDKSASINSATVTSALSGDGNTCSITVNADHSKCPYVITYTVYASGVVDMKVDYSPKTNALRRIGLDMVFPAGYENVEYYAKGPWENYIDRQTGSFLGRYTTTVDDMFEMYPHPQSYGNRMALRDLTLVNPENGNAIRIEAEGEVSFSLSHYDQRQFLVPELHPWDLKKDDVVYATIDYMQRGLGNGSCGPGTEYQYYCPYGKVSHKLRISTATGVDTGVEEVGIGECSVEYDATSQQVAFAGMPNGAEVTVVNFGGVVVGKTVASGGMAVVSLASQPKAPYIAVIRCNGEVRSHRFIRW